MVGAHDDPDHEGQREGVQHLAAQEESATTTRNVRPELTTVATAFG
jgi:hypothetical protein